MLLWMGGPRFRTRPPGCAYNIFALSDSNRKQIITSDIIRRTKENATENGIGIFVIILMLKKIWTSCIAYTYAGNARWTEHSIPATRCHTCCSICLWKQQAHLVKRCSPSSKDFFRRGGDDWLDTVRTAVEIFEPSHWCFVLLRDRTVLSTYFDV